MSEAERISAQLDVVLAKRTPAEQVVAARRARKMELLGQYNTCLVRHPAACICGARALQGIERLAMEQLLAAIRDWALAEGLTLMADRLLRTVDLDALLREG